ncbi:MAG: DUF5119 domain-containing protein [Bacteroidales bacterium]
MKKQIGMGVVLTVLALPALLSCRKDLCYDHNHQANVQVNLSYTHDWYTHWEPGVSLDDDWDIDWSVVNPVDPEGTRLITYPHYEQLASNSYNLPAKGAKINMNAGYHDLLFYNNDTEYILIGGKGSTSVASTRTRTRVSHSKLYPDETTRNPPDMLYAAYFENLYIEELPEDDPHAKVTKILDVELSPRVFTYILRYEFKSGLEYVAQARGSLSAMSGSVYLATGHTDEDPITLLFDCDRKKWGYETIMRSFGVPGIRLEESKAPDNAGVDASGDIVTRGDTYFGYNRDEANKVIQITKSFSHRLILELYLINGKEKLIDFDVTDQVNKQPRGGVIVVKDIVVTPEEGSSEGGGFDTEVDGWEDDEIVNIPIS